MTERPEAWPVVLTPFTAAGDVDFAALDAYIDWLIAHDAAGLFAVALSGEMYELTSEERTRVARRVVVRAAGRVPVAASALGDDAAAVIDAARALADAGVDIVVLVASAVVPEGAGDEVLLEVAADVAEAVPDIALGVYECPVPYHRVLDDASVAELARTGRFVFFKETSHDLARMQGRVQDASATRLRVFNAGIENYAESIEVGVAGLSGWVVNVAPDLVSRLGALAAAGDPDAARLQGVLASIEQRMGSTYPASAKAIVARSGVPGWETRSRWRPAEVDHALVDELVADIERERAR